MPLREVGSYGANTVLVIIDDFIEYLPEGRAVARRREISAHYQDTWFSWIGGYSEDEPFYDCIQSPVVILELNHHCGVFLSNNEPKKFHIDTLVRNSATEASRGSKEMATQA
ncbi:DUF3500 domain-containing protein [Pseudarthrobacter equi]|uniref:DUF3500 domain-containing protein n=1 Tax=Pseudarthrobacter equi TaxID=728066 RepID=UPI0021C1E68D|nr:DUF3500 domain-containing protein [Pseudarthrobacter equi]